jgi:hypothetical protein
MISTLVSALRYTPERVRLAASGVHCRDVQFPLASRQRGKCSSCYPQARPSQAHTRTRPVQAASPGPAACSSSAASVHVRPDFSGKLDVASSITLIDIPGPFAASRSAGGAALEMGL